LDLIISRWLLLRELFEVFGYRLTINADQSSKHVILTPLQLNGHLGSPPDENIGLYGKLAYAGLD
jgi:hypothetical protein